MFGEQNLTQNISVFIMKFAVDQIIGVLKRLMVF